MKLYSLPVHLLRQMLFCPRIPWFMEVVGLRPAEPFWVMDGNEFHLRQAMLARSRTLQGMGLDKAGKLYNVHVHSESLCLHGIIDLLLVTESECIPVELKSQKPPNIMPVVVQLAAYGLLAEEVTGKPCRRGILLYGPRIKTRLVAMDDSVRQLVVEMSCKLHHLIGNSPTIPDTSATVAQCTQCEYVNFCNDRE